MKFLPILKSFLFILLGNFKKKELKFLIKNFNLLIYLSNII